MEHGIEREGRFVTENITAVVLQRRKGIAWWYSKCEAVKLRCRNVKMNGTASGKLQLFFNK